MDKPRSWAGSHSFRLPGENRGPGSVAITICVARRRAVLTAARDVKGALDVDLGRLSQDGHAQVLVACFMPDHAHLLLSLDGRGKELSAYIQAWKAAWSKRLAREEERPFWQRSFYDHWIRRGEDGEYARYILSNPVRKGIVSDWKAYPFTRAYILDL